MSNTKIQSAHPAGPPEVKQMLIKGASEAKLNALMTFWSFLMAHSNYQHSKLFTSKHLVLTQWQLVLSPVDRKPVHLRCFHVG